MIELLRANDLVLISRVEALLAGAGVRLVVADRHMSAVEGSLGFLPRRLLVPDEDAELARETLIDAGLGDWLNDG
ncbi:DUF2007 domain-containing protein [Methylocella sp.]|uniref:DUF2007 domain-containing protein n=1 Tax=Methylocella sp. TaxID=1978226 RepID=UPI00378435FA